MLHYITLTNAVLLNKLEIRHLVVRTAANAHPLNPAHLYRVSEPFLALLLSIIYLTSYLWDVGKGLRPRLSPIFFSLYGSGSPSILLFDAVCDVFEVPEF